MYHWEQNSKAHQKKAKKSGTVVLHPDEEIDTSFDRLIKPTLIDKRSKKESPEDEGKVLTQLMTTETRKVLEDTMGFNGLLKGQAQCYKGIFVGRDVILHSRTGSGKTLAYVLPIIERHLIQKDQNKKARDDEGETGPFLLIFLFSNDLGLQTKNVISKIYPKLRVAVAGIDSVATEDGNAPVDVLIGTVHNMDVAIRGRKSAAEATRAEEQAKAKEEKLFGKKRGRQEKGKGGKSKQKKNEEEGSASGEEDNDSELDESSEDERDHPKGTAEGGEVSAANVQSIVMDEVDTTLGPRFTNVGRRMKNLLKFIRRANGSLTDGLLSDFRVHHYVLCGATIPNWVVKAGFLGVKKYYYKLVDSGSPKLPQGLEVFRMNCPKAERLETALKLLKRDRSFFGRCVVFGTGKQVEALEKLILQSTAEENLTTATTAVGGGGKKKKNQSQQLLRVRTLVGEKSDMERYAAIEDFNNNIANVLLCTDIAARGLDMMAVDTVLMLSLPMNRHMEAETFVHRAGRTARVGHSGRCLVLMDKSDEAEMHQITHTTHAVFKVYVFPGDINHNTTTTNNNNKQQQNPTGSKSKGKTSSTTTTSNPNSGSMIRLQLTVKNPFKYSKPDMQVPAAAEVLARELKGEEFCDKIVTLPAKESSSSEVVTFEVPAELVHMVESKLWKYKLTEIKN